MIVTQQPGRARKQNAQKQQSDSETLPAGVIRVKDILYTSVHWPSVGQLEPLSYQLHYISWLTGAL